MKRFREALRLDPDYAQAHNNLAAMLQLAGQVDEALDHYRRAVTLRPDNVEARGNLAQLLSRQGRAAEAVAEFEQVLADQSGRSSGAQRPRLDPRHRRGRRAAQSCAGHCSSPNGQPR